MGGGGTGPERKWGHRKQILSRAPPLFGSKSTISRFGERFGDGQYSLVSFFFAVAYSRCPRARPFVTVGGRAPWSRRHCVQRTMFQHNRHYKASTGRLSSRSVVTPCTLRRRDKFDSIAATAIRDKRSHCLLPTTSPVTSAVKWTLIRLYTATRHRLRLLQSETCHSLASLGRSPT